MANSSFKRIGGRITLEGSLPFHHFGHILCNHLANCDTCCRYVFHHLSTSSIAHLDMVYVLPKLSSIDSILVIRSMYFSCLNFLHFCNTSCYFVFVLDIFKN